MSSTEEWRSVEGFEGLYEVSNFGQVRSVDRVTLARNGRLQPYKGRVLKARGGSRGYYQVVLMCQGKRTNRTVHSLVAEAFIGERPEGYQVCHCDGDQSNNRLENLRYDTPTANQADRKAHGTYQHGESASQSKLTWPKVREIRRLKASGWTLKAIGERFSVHLSTIHQIVNYKTWKHDPEG